MFICLIFGFKTEFSQADELSLAIKEFTSETKGSFKQEIFGTIFIAMTFNCEFYHAQAANSYEFSEISAWDC